MEFMTNIKTFAMVIRVVIIEKLPSFFCKERS